MTADINADPELMLAGAAQLADLAGELDAELARVRPAPDVIPRGFEPGSDVGDPDRVVPGLPGASLLGSVREHAAELMLLSGQLRAEADQLDQAERSITRELRGLGERVIG